MNEERQTKHETEHEGEAAESAQVDGGADLGGNHAQVPGAAAGEATEPVSDSSAQAPEVEEGESVDTGEAAASEVEMLREECAYLHDQLLRARAEFENFRKQKARETERIRKVAAEGVIRDLLSVLDHLEMALQHQDSGAETLVEGVKMVARQFHDVLHRHGLEPIPAVGHPFDPHVHEALSQASSDAHPADVVVSEFQRGYRLGGQVLRPSKVSVNVAPGQPADMNEATDATPASSADTSQE